MNAQAARINRAVFELGDCSADDVVGLIVHESGEELGRSRVNGHFNWLLGVDDRGQFEKVGFRPFAERTPKGIRLTERARQHYARFHGLVNRSGANAAMATRRRTDTNDRRKGQVYTDPDLAEAHHTLGDEGYFDVNSLTDERQKTMRSIAQRSGQQKFRAGLLRAYRGRCAVTNCDAGQALEAAHIIGYLGPKTDHISNGLLLRADIHTLFDLDLIGIEPKSLRVVLVESLQDTCYAELDGQQISVPTERAHRPNVDALQQRWTQFRSPAARG